MHWNRTLGAALCEEALQRPSSMTPWKTLAEETSTLESLRVSLLTLPESADKVYLDLRRVFLNDGHFKPLKTGLRVQLSEEQLRCIVRALLSIGRLEQTEAVVGGVRMKRRNGSLRFYKVVQEGARPLLVVNPAGAAFILKTLTDFQEVASSCLAADEDSETEEESKKWY